jgi:alpha-N-arabinofuranosidase
LYDALKKPLPSRSHDLDRKNYDISIPAGITWDTHYYEQPSFPLSNLTSLMIGNNEPTTKTFLVPLENTQYMYSADKPEGLPFAPSAKDTHIDYPRLLSAIAESTYLIGAERDPECNADEFLCAELPEFQLGVSPKQFEKIRR